MNIRNGWAVSSSLVRMEGVGPSHQSLCAHEIVKHLQDSIDLSLQTWQTMKTKSIQHQIQCQPNYGFQCFLCLTHIKMIYSSEILVIYANAIQTNTRSYQSMQSMNHQSMNQAIST